MRKLVSVQMIKALHPIEGAERIEMADVLGWHVVVQKGAFKEGEVCLYAEVDSLFPDKPEFAFLKVNDVMKPVKTRRIRGQYSQGVCFPLSLLPPLPTGEVYPIGKDVTDLLGVVKYDPPEYYTKPISRVSRYPDYPNMMFILKKILPKGLYTKYFTLPALAPLPAVVPKPDETRVQVLQGVLDKYASRLCYVTEKVDGTATSAYMDDEGVVHVCSKYSDITYNPDDAYWRAWLPHVKWFQKFPPFTIFQGELCGPKVQSNTLNLSSKRIFLFNVFNAQKGTYLDWTKLCVVASLLGISVVPIIKTDYPLPRNVDELVTFAMGRSMINPLHEREGIVIRVNGPIYDTTFGDFFVRNRVSFKVINPRYTRV